MLQQEQCLPPNFWYTGDAALDYCAFAWCVYADNDKAQGRVLGCDATILDGAPTVTATESAKSLAPAFATSLHNASTFYLQRTSVTTLPRLLFAAAPRLSFVQLSGNSLAYLPPGIFDGLPPGAVVDLSGNPATLTAAGNSSCTFYDGGTVNGVRYCSACTMNGTRLVNCSAFTGAELDLRGWAIETVDVAAFAGLGTSLAVVRMGDGPDFTLTLLPGAFSGLSLTTLDLSEARLAPTLAHGVFSGLTAGSISLRGANITTIESGAFSGLVASSIDLRDNKLTAVPTGLLSGVTLPSVAAVLLSDNPITTVQSHAFAGASVSSADTLSLKALGITAIAPLAFSGLQVGTLDLSDNAIQSLDDGALGNMTAGTVLLGGGAATLHTLRAGAFRGTTVTSPLDLSGLNLTLVEDRAFAGLTCPGLSLAGNRLPSITAGMFQDLTLAAPGPGTLPALNLSRAGVADIQPYSFLGLPPLASLDLSHNVLSEVVSNAFFGVVATDLVLSPAWAPLSTLRQHAFRNVTAGTVHADGVGVATVEASALQGLTVTHKLSLTSNAITSLATGFADGLTAPTFRALALSANPVTAIGARAFAGAVLTGTPAQVAAATLDLSSLLVTDVAAWAFAGVSCGELDLSGNAIATLPGYFLGNATVHGTVTLTGNPLRTLSSNAFSAVAARLAVCPAMSGMGITTIQANAFHGFECGTDLDLSGNSITTLVPEALANLVVAQSLSLRYNGLTSVQGQAFVGTVVGTQLLLSNNAIRDIAASAFTALVVVERLVLTANPLPYVPRRVITGQDVAVSAVVAGTSSCDAAGHGRVTWKGATVCSDCPPGK